ncbi:reverse transcriptase domain-containing protein [Tanacetum coccineum]
MQAHCDGQDLVYSSRLQLWLDVPFDEESIATIVLLASLSSPIRSASEGVLCVFFVDIISVGYAQSGRALSELYAVLVFTQFFFWVSLQFVNSNLRLSLRRLRVRDRSPYFQMRLIVTGLTCLGTIFRDHPYPFDYPIRRLTMQEILNKFIDEGRREHEEMEIFIKEFRTTNELLLKTRSNLLSELKIKVNELSKVLSNVLIPKNEVKGVTTIVKKLMKLDENKNEPPRFEQDVQEKPHDDGVEYKSSSIRERTTQPLVKPQQSSVPFPNRSLLTNKSKLKEACTETINERCSAVLLNKLPLKEKDPTSFTIPCQVLEKHKEVEDLVGDHSSRLENPHMEVLTEREIANKFSDEHLMALKSKSNNDEPCGNVYRKKVYGGFYWPSVSKDANEYILWDCFPNLELFDRFGVPKALISDRGTYFCNSQLEKALQRYGVAHKLPMAYHPQSNGQTKVTNRAIKCILERSVGYNPKVYGKACHLPVEIEHKAHWALKQCNIDLTLAIKSRLMQLNELAKFRDGAYENTRIYKEWTKKWHDSRLCGDKDFKVGDQVLWKRIRKKKTKTKPKRQNQARE